MEMQPAYNTAQIVVRPTCFVPAAANWEPPTAIEIQFVFAQSSSTASRVAAELDVPLQTVELWLSGAESVPYAVWALICFNAGYGVIWK